MRENLGAEHVVVAMHGVVSIDDGDVQPRVLHRVLLNLVDVAGPAVWNVRARNVATAREERPGPVADQRLLHPGVGQRKRCIDLHHLSDLLACVHSVEQGPDPCLNRLAFIQPGSRRRWRRGVDAR